MICWIGYGTSLGALVHDKSFPAFTILKFVSDLKGWKEWLWNYKWLGWWQRFQERIKNELIEQILRCAVCTFLNKRRYSPDVNLNKAAVVSGAERQRGIVQRARKIFLLYYSAFHCISLFYAFFLFCFWMRALLAFMHFWSFYTGLFMYRFMLNKIFQSRLFSPTFGLESY